MRVKHILQAGVEWWGRENSGSREVSAATAVKALISRALWPHERLLRQKAVRGPGLSYTSTNVLASVIKMVYSGEGMEAENMMVAWHKIFPTVFWGFFFHIDPSKESFGNFFLIAGPFHPQLSLNLIPPKFRHFNASDTVSLPMYCIYIRTLTQRVRVVHMPCPSRTNLYPFGENIFSVENVWVRQIILEYEMCSLAFPL